MRFNSASASWNVAGWFEATSKYASPLSLVGYRSLNNSFSVSGRRCKTFLQHPKYVFSSMCVLGSCPPENTGTIWLRSFETFIYGSAMSLGWTLDTKKELLRSSSSSSLREIDKNLKSNSPAVFSLKPLNSSLSLTFTSLSSMLVFSREREYPLKSRISCLNFLVLSLSCSTRASLSARVLSSCSFICSHLITPRLSDSLVFPNNSLKYWFRLTVFGGSIRPLRNLRGEIRVIDGAAVVVLDDAVLVAGIVAPVEGAATDVAVVIVVVGVVRVAVDVGSNVDCSVPDVVVDCSSGVDDVIVDVFPVVGIDEGGEDSVVFVVGWSSCWFI